MSEILDRLRKRLLGCSDDFAAYEESIAAKGFLAHRRHCEVYERMAIDAGELEILRRYWAETGKEHLGTAGCGQLTSMVRSVPACSLYRSEFLDRLAAESKLSEEGQRAQGRDIEACHRRVNEKALKGVFVDRSVECAQRNAESHELLRGLTEQDPWGKPIWGEFKDTLNKVATVFGGENLTLRSRGKFHYFERRLVSFPTLSAFIYHEDERPLRLGRVAFHIAFAVQGTKIDPRWPADPANEARLGFRGILPGFAVYGRFESLEERALCAAAHIFAGNKFFDLIDT